LTLGVSAYFTTVAMAYVFPAASQNGDRGWRDLTLGIHFERDGVHWIWQRLDLNEKPSWHGWTFRWSYPFSTYELADPEVVRWSALGIKIAKRRIDWQWNYGGVADYVVTPYWFALPLTLILPLSRVALTMRQRRQRLRQWRWRRMGRCAACGYDLRGTPERCPECGALTRDSSADGSWKLAKGLKGTRQR